MEIKTFSETIHPMQHSIEFYVQAFEHDSEIRGLTKGTIEAYKCVIRQFSAKYPINSGIEGYKCFLMDLRKENLSQKTIENKFSALSTFFDFLEFEGYTGTNDILKFRKRYLRTYKSNISESRKVISLENLAQLIMAPNWIGDQALIILLAKTGIRRNELITLDRSDVDLKSNSIYLKNTAKRSNKLLFFDDETKAFLKAYLATRKDNNTALFLNHIDTRISRDYVYYLITEHAFKLGFHNPKSKRLSDRFTTHNLRHCFTDYLRKAGMTREHIQELRGDVGKEAIDIYIHISTDELKEAYMRYIYKLNISPDPNTPRERQRLPKLIKIKGKTKGRRRSLRITRGEGKERI